MKLVRIVKNWQEPDLMRQTPGGLGTWNNIRFTLEPVEECDYLIFLNNLMEVTITASCPPSNVWAIMQEPYLKGHSDWLIEKHDYFSKVFTPHPLPITKHIASQPALPWYINKTYDQLLCLSPQEKKKQISWVVGNANDLPGHAKRYSLLKSLQKDREINIDLFGRAVQPIDDKWDALAPYQYSLAIENSSHRDYWTEKIADCFLARTIPIYYGCVNLADYFPEESFIQIDISDSKRCVENIKKVLKNDNPLKRLSALEKARKLVLKKYQLFPFIADKITNSSRSCDNKRLVKIPPYQRSIRATISHRLYKLKKISKRVLG